MQYRHVFSNARGILPLCLVAAGIISANLISLHVHPFRSFYNELAIVVGLLFAFLAYLFSHREKVFLPGILLLPVSILLMLCLHAIVLLYSGQSVFIAAMYLALACIAIIFGANYCSDDVSRERFCFAFASAHLFAALISVAIEVIQILEFDLRPFAMYLTIQGQTGVRPYANLAQPNQLALLLCFGIASLWWLNQRKCLNNLISFFVAMALVFGLVLTQSRIAWIILPLFLLFASSGLFGQQRKSFWLLLALFTLYILLTWYLPEISSMLGYSSGSVVERVSGRSERTVLSEQAIEMIRMHPWLGIGWAKFGAYQVQIGADFSPSIYAEHSHNLVLNLAAELGLPFAIVFFGGILVWLVKVCCTKQMRLNTEISLALLFFIAVGVHSLVEFPLWYTFVLLPIALLLGMVHQHRWQARWQISRTYLVFISIGGLIATAAFTYDYQRTVEGFQAFRQTSDFAKVDSKKVKKPSFTLLPDFFDYFELLLISPSAGMSKEDIEFVEQGSRRFGFVHILNKLAEVYVLNGRQQDAVRTMMTLHRLHPFYYAEYHSYWQKLAEKDQRFALILREMPISD